MNNLKIDQEGDLQKLTKSTIGTKQTKNVFGTAAKSSILNQIEKIKN
jgi:hypothetical protein